MPRERVGIEDVKLFAAIPINVASSDANRLSFGIGDGGRRNVAKEAPVPFQDEVRKAEAGDDQFERAVAVNIGDGNSIIELAGVVKKQAAVISEHALIRRESVQLGIIALFLLIIVMDGAVEARRETQSSLRAAPLSAA